MTEQLRELTLSDLRQGHFGVNRENPYTTFDPLDFGRLWPRGHIRSVRP